MKTAYLFPGQGAQATGIGRDVADAYPEAGKIFDTANAVVGYDLTKLCFEGPGEKLEAHRKAATRKAAWYRYAGNTGQICGYRKYV